MKRIAMLLLLLAVYAQPARAGHGTIEETDTGIFVEYTGDSSDKPAVSGLTAAPLVPAAAGVPADAPRTQTAEPPKPDLSEVTAQQEARRRANEARAEVRRQEAESRPTKRARTKRVGQSVTQGQEE